jgi:inorganic pyrophosphatase
VRFKHIKALKDLTEIQKEEIQFFWERYKDVQFKLKGQHDKKVVVEAWEGIEEASKIITNAHKRFIEKFGEMSD